MQASTALQQVSRLLQHNTTLSDCLHQRHTCSACETWSNGHLGVVCAAVACLKELHVMWTSALIMPLLCMQVLTYCWQLPNRPSLHDASAVNAWNTATFMSDLLFACSSQDTSGNLVSTNLEH